MASSMMPTSIYHKTVSGTTNSNGNISFNLSVMNYAVVSVFDATSFGIVAIPYYRNSDGWAAHCRVDDGNFAVRSNASVVLEVYYIKR